MENNNPKPKRKLELKKEVITILQDEQMAKIFGGETDSRSICPASCDNTCGDTECGGKKSCTCTSD